MTKIVRKKLSSSSFTEARKRRLAKLAARPDSTIDFSDIPELTEKFWRNAVRNAFYRPIKKQLTLRLDADVIAWLRKQGKGYQTRANALLRAAIVGTIGTQMTEGLFTSRNAKMVPKSVSAEITVRSSLAARTKIS